jgi:hypothetical protein
MAGWLITIGILFFMRRWRLSFGVGIGVAVEKSQVASASSAAAMRSRSIGLGSIHPLQNRFTLTTCKPSARAKAN